MSIRYTLRHNIPSAKLAEEDVNDSSTWDLNLLRKHELAETDDSRVVYRQKDGSIVDWTDQATTRAEEIKDECLLIKDDITEYANQTEARLNTIISTAEDQQEEVNQLIEDVQDMIDLEKINNMEIDTIVAGGNS